MAIHPIGLSCAIATILAAAVWPKTAATAPDAAIHPYSAVYQIEYKGKAVGTMEFSVEYSAAEDVYQFTSRSTARGLLKLISPRPVVERSNFSSEAGRVTPLEFWYEDGTRRADGNFHIRFDWDNELAFVDTEEQQHEFSAPLGTLDRATMQVQVMLDTARAEPSASYTLANDDGLRTYNYRPDGDAQLQTPLGEYAARAFVQQRAGSSRQTVMWIAGDLNHLPVRIEQQRDGETRTVFLLQSVQWLDEK